MELLMNKDIKHWLKELIAINDKDVLMEKVESFPLSEFILSDKDYNACIKLAQKKYKKFDKNIVPYFLDALYRSNDKCKFIMFCYLLEKNCTDLMFITNLENHPMLKEKFEILFPFLLSVIDKCWNGIGNCMYLLLLKAVEYDELFNEENINLIIETTANRMTQTLDYVTKNDLDESTAFSLEVLADVARYYNNNALLNKVEETLNLDSNNIKLFSVVTLIANGRTVNSQVIEKLAEDTEYSNKLFELLENINRVDVFTEQYANQEHLAKSNLIDWLKYPTELGEIPAEIELLGEIEEDDIIYYLFKFRSDSERFKEKGWMVGLSGGYEKDKIPTAQTTGTTFSEFETVEKDYKKQGYKILEFIRDAWKKRAEEYERECMIGEKNNG